VRKALIVVAFLSAAAGGRLFFASPEHGRLPVLTRVIDGGKMEEFLHAPSEKAAILDWVARGGRRDDWDDVQRVFSTRCASCHHTDASFDMLALDRYEPAAAAARVRPLLLEKITGGTMGKYLETADAQHSLVSWIEDGAREQAWPRARRILEADCVPCHNPEGVQGIVPLTVYAAVKRLAATPTPEPNAPWLALVAMAIAVVAIAIAVKP